jgi:hypothetical protein
MNPLVRTTLLTVTLAGLPSAARGGEWRPFEPVRAGEPPAGPAANPIDRFVEAKLRERGLAPTGPADKQTLVRRATFDLTGLPPTPAEIDAFLADKSADAYAKLVDRLLASPAYGERWGRHWLDVARYADTGGFEADHLYATAWQYRDYVIRAFNADKPFDRFVKEQVAGDELWPDDADAATATGLYCVGPVLPESASVSDLLEYEWLTDVADTTGAAFLGLTFGCARCHDHKYDPLTQRDYCGLQAVFAASDRPFPDKVRILRVKALNGLLSDAPFPKKLLNDPRCTIRTDADVRLHLFHRAEPLSVHRLHRGEFGKPREATPPAVPAALGKAEFEKVPPGQRRAAFANWLASAENPLTARVIVNRVWGWHFGQALVRTPSDFGAQGEPPTHPELLDWLAKDFTAHGWRLKRLHRQIMLSATYQQSPQMRNADFGMRNETQSVPFTVAASSLVLIPHSAFRTPYSKDPDDRLLWHFPRQRLDGETIRDAMLASAGTLNGKRFGPPVVPPLGGAELAGLFDAKGKWPVTKDPAEHTRRSVYLLVRRTFVYPLFAAFDPPETMTSCPQRPRTVVPTQALTLLNSPLVREQSAAFAKRLRSECGEKPEAIVPRAWALAFGRPPTQVETDRTLAFLRKRAAPEDPQAALAELCLALFNANEFVFID